MFKAVCADCGKECSVPFKPTEGRPVKCSDCFKKGKPQQGGFGGGRKDFGNRNSFEKRKDYDVTCSDCGKATTVPFKPTQGKPVKCRDCFRK